MREGPVLSARFGDAHLTKPQILSHEIACVAKVRAVPFVRVFRLSRDFVMVMVDGLMEKRRTRGQLSQ